MPERREASHGSLLRDQVQQMLPKERSHEARDHNPYAVPIHWYAVNHGTEDRLELLPVFKTINELCESNPGGTVAVLTEDSGSVLSASLQIAESVLEGTKPSDALGNYFGDRQFPPSRGKLTPQLKKARKSHINDVMDRLREDGFLDSLFRGLDGAAKRHPGQVLWLPEGTPPHIAIEVGKIFNESYDFFSSEGAESYEEFVAKKIAMVQRYADRQALRDEYVSATVKELTTVPEIAAIVGVRGHFHSSQVIDSLSAQGYNVHEHNPALNGVRAEQTPGLQIALKAQQGEEITGDDISLTIEATHRVSAALENRPSTNTNLHIVHGNANAWVDAHQGQGYEQIAPGDKIFEEPRGVLTLQNLLASDTPAEPEDTPGIHFVGDGGEVIEVFSHDRDDSESPGEDRER